MPHLATRLTAACLAAALLWVPTLSGQAATAAPVTIFAIA